VSFCLLNPCAIHLFLYNLFGLNFAGERRIRTDWRVQELIAATEALLALNDADNDNHNNTPELLKDAPYLSLKGRIQKEQVFFMGHSFGGATALTAAHRRPDLVEKGGAVIAHEPMVDWMPDDARRSLFPLDRLQGLESSQNFTGGTGGLEYHTTTTTITGQGQEAVSSVHDLDLLILYSDEWRKQVRCNSCMCLNSEVL
jgi:pimeloyl-ACP methyl ester carboxylesterase